MKEAEVKQITIKIKSNKGYEFDAEKAQILFDGFMRVLMPEYAKKNTTSTTLKADDEIELKELEAEEKQTRPPYRYHEASIIKTLEAKGIGRPSTYASIISLIIDKHYVEKEYRYLKPTSLGTAISDYLSVAFPDIFDLTFTAQMEDSLDDIANGDKKLLETLDNFYLPLKKELDEKKEDNNTLQVAEDVLDEKCPQCGGDLVARFGKYGKFYACSNYPTCKYIKPNLRFVKNAVCPECGGRLVIRFSKKGKKFYGCENYPKCKHVQWTLIVQPVEPAKEPEKSN
jgi:DNA topoisomerase-1